MSHLKFSTPVKVATMTRDTQTSSARNGQTWNVYFGCSVSFEKYVCDIRVAGTYILSINGVDVVTVAGIAAASLNNQFVAPTPIELSPGLHTFKLRLSTGASIQWYNCSGTTQNPINNLTGDGEPYCGWGRWAEPGAGTAACISGSIYFKTQDSVVVAEMPRSGNSTFSYTAQSWTVTLKDPIYLAGFLKYLPNADTGYAFSIDGVLIDTTVKTSTQAERIAWGPTDPILLAAGVHTFSIDPVASSRDWSYQDITATAFTGSGAQHITDHGSWVEGPDPNDRVDGRYYFIPITTMS